MTNDKPQAEKFRDAARAAECDENEGRWDERLKKMATHRPGDGKPSGR